MKQFLSYCHLILERLSQGLTNQIKRLNNDSVMASSLQSVALPKPVGIFVVRKTFTVCEPVLYGCVYRGHCTSASAL